MAQPHAVIMGAGIIGLSCALELQSLGLSVTVLERGEATRQASWAAAGMLAARDPENPAALTPLAELSIELYPSLLERIAKLSGMTVPIETEWALEPAHHFDATPQHDLPQLQASHFVRVAEQSLDPRKLAAAALAAVRASGVDVHEHTTVLRWNEERDGVTVTTTAGSIHANYVLDCTGAWSEVGTRPAKGQMLRVTAPGAMATAALGNMVVRTSHIYMVPRLDDTVVIGATVEDAGFDTTNHDADLHGLRAQAAALIPALAKAPEVERWAGLRPDTPDHLPFIGRTGERSFVAAGHFRNGILLAPATARVIAQLILREQLSADLAPFDPNRSR